jgi:hypothetical protein
VISLLISVAGANAQSAHADDQGEVTCKEAYRTNPCYSYIFAGSKAASLNVWEGLDEVESMISEEEYTTADKHAILGVIKEKLRWEGPVQKTVYTIPVGRVGIFKTTIIHGGAANTTNAYNHRLHFDVRPVGTGGKDDAGTSILPWVTNQLCGGNARLVSSKTVAELFAIFYGNAEMLHEDLAVFCKEKGLDRSGTRAVMATRLAKKFGSEGPDVPQA